MFTAEYSYEDDLAAQKEEAEAIGFSNGQKVGFSNGERVGRNKGRMEGAINTLVDLVKKQFLDIEIAAKQVDMKVGEFQKLL